MLARRNRGLPAPFRRVFALPAIGVVALCGLGLPARADDTPAAPPTATTPKLPSFAMNPQAPWTAAGEPATSPWTGFYVGSEVFAASVKGKKGLAGGSAFVGYNREFENNLVLGIEGSAGFAANSFKHGPYVGYDFAATNMKLGYDMGRLLPFVTAGFAFAKPTSSRFSGAGDSLNDLFNSSSNIRGAGMVGAGFDYMVTDKLTVGVAVSAGVNRLGTGPLIAP